MSKIYMKTLSNSCATLAIIIINMLVFIALNVIHDLANVLLLNPDLAMIVAKPWTLVTVFFSHQIHIHLLANMGLVFIFGKELENIIHSKTVFLVYFVCGFAGSLAIVPVAYFFGYTGLVAGASAAVWGVVAAFAAIRPNAIILRSKAKLWVWALFIGNAFLTILNPEISVGAGAHAAGIVVGLLCGYWLKDKEDK